MRYGEIKIWLHVVVYTLAEQGYPILKACGPQRWGITYKEYIVYYTMAEHQLDHYMHSTQHPEEWSASILFAAPFYLSPGQVGHSWRCYITGIHACPSLKYRL